MLAPIVLFVYNRPLHTRQMLQSLSKNNSAGDSIIYIYADGPAENATDEMLSKIAEVRAVIREKKWGKEVYIIQSETNKGLANSVIKGVTEVVNKHGKIIVLEDDLVVSSFFLDYMNKLLAIYENEERIISIHGYNYPVKIKSKDTTFCLKGADCWGWATWKRGWDLFEANAEKLLQQIEENNLSNEFDFWGTYNFTHMLKAQIDGKVDSWAIRWYASAFIKNKFTVYPVKSLVENIGRDGSGTHFKFLTDHFDKSKVADSFEVTKLSPVVENIRIKKKLAVYFRNMKKEKTSLLYSVKQFFKWG